ncbi:hypothetical protein [Amantichitinum ursilacus]|uniref:Uncharacterized protein n=1 Tax=Amantichitinum ursilacus TaxID=857265 RepID=A0A0N0GR28_9NEIS|nr:hypothetical protein [Amantichitinum ursilacus]KPC55430.1 hypothetical protein WG78_02195 [Amantichitinum ursilacus]
MALGSPLYRKLSGARDASADAPCDCTHSRYVPRAEFSSRIDAVEARTDARIASMQTTTSSIQAEMRTFREEMRTFREDMRRLREEIKEIWTTIAELRRDMKVESRQLKFWMVGTGIGVVLGIAAFNATVLSSMVASFESGKNLTAVQIQLQQQGAENQRMLERVRNQLELIEARTAALHTVASSAQ